MSLLEKIIETRDFLVEKGLTEPEFGLILGSGLGELAEEVENAIVIDYADIPNWGQSTVVGHAGKLVYGDLAGRKVLALQGRFHFYEGNQWSRNLPSPCHEGSGLSRCHCHQCCGRYRLRSRYPSGYYRPYQSDW